MLKKAISIFLVIGSFANGYAEDSNNKKDDAPTTQSEKSTTKPERTWDDGRPMTDWEHYHMGEVYLGGD